MKLHTETRLSAALPATTGELREFLFEQTFLRNKNIEVIAHEGFNTGDITIFKSGWLGKTEFLFEVVASQDSRNSIELIKMGKGLTYLRHHMSIKHSQQNGWIVIEDVSFATKTIFHNLLWRRILKNHLLARKRVIQSISTHQRAIERNVLQAS